jgi:peptidoglycan hydrolase-like protein with peptidoglycan-binding domain
MLVRLLILLIAFLPAPALAEAILFVGNSYTFGAASPAWKYRASTVTDLNDEGIGGVPALFKAFAGQRGLDYDVTLETAGGKDLRWHWENRRDKLDRAWDHVVLQEWSALNKTRAGSPDYPAFTRRFADLFATRNPKVRIHLTAIWPRPDQIYPTTGAWHGTPITTQALAFREEADRAAAQPGIASVLPVGQAFLRAFDTGFADPNPYDGIAFGQVSLWGFDHYHGSAFGYYLEALVVFGRVTGQDPRSLGREEAAGQELGLSRDQAGTLQQIAWETLGAEAKK